jgi:hypothetical protein
MSGPELLPCPLCGKAPAYSRAGYGFSEGVSCSCGLDFDGSPEAWNRRDPAVLAALPEVEALVAEAVAQERERCAKVAECYWSGIPESEVGEAVCDAVFAVAAAIRAGGGQ